jgi:hypothetical protein
MMKFTREQLYREIWETSARQVAVKYKLNYSKLLKQCKAFDIPLPGGKYLYNKRQGLDTSSYITPLSGLKETEVEVDKQKTRVSQKKSMVLSENKKDEFEEDLGNKILFDKATVLSSLEFLDEDKKNSIIEVFSSFEFRENKRLHKKVVAYKGRIATWNQRVKAAQSDYYDPKYQRNDLTQPQFIKEVSQEQLPRLYRLLDTLCLVFEKIGEKITDDFKIQIVNDLVSFEIIESTDKVKHELTKKEAQELVKYNDERKTSSYAFKPNIRKYDHIPNGLLRIKLSNGKYIKDTKSKQLEDMISEIVILTYQCYSEVRTNREAWEEKERVRQEEKQAARKLQEQINQEKEKTREFLNIISDYKLAKEIREFVDQVKENDEVAKESIAWMLAKADWIDPNISKEDKILGKRAHHKTEEEKDNDLRDRNYYW